MMNTVIFATALLSVLGFSCASNHPPVTSHLSFSNMRTGGRTSQIITSALGKTAWWWSGLRGASGTTCPATTICPLPAKKAQVSSDPASVFLKQPAGQRSNESPTSLPPVSCGAPPEVENAYMFGKRREEYPAHSIVRYQCRPGFRQRHLPVVRCRADGQWDEPRVECTHGESAPTPTALLSKLVLSWVSLPHQWMLDREYGSGEGGRPPQTALSTKEQEREDKQSWKKKIVEIMWWRPQVKNATAWWCNWTRPFPSSSNIFNYIW